MEIAIIGLLLVMVMVVRLVLKARANWRDLEAQARHRRLHRAIYNHRPVAQPRAAQPRPITHPTNKPGRPVGLNPARPAGFSPVRPQTRRHR